MTTRWRCHIPACLVLPCDDDDDMTTAAAPHPNDDTPTMTTMSHPRLVLTALSSHMRALIHLFPPHHIPQTSSSPGSSLHTNPPPLPGPFAYKCEHERIVSIRVCVCIWAVMVVPSPALSMTTTRPLRFLCPHPPWPRRRHNDDNTLWRRDRALTGTTMTTMQCDPTHPLPFAYKHECEHNCLCSHLCLYASGRGHPGQPSTWPVWYTCGYGKPYPPSDLYLWPQVLTHCGYRYRYERWYPRVHPWYSLPPSPLALPSLLLGMIWDRCKNDRTAGRTKGVRHTCPGPSKRRGEARYFAPKGTQGKGGVGRKSKAKG